MNILAICGSLRKKSTNLGLLRYAQHNAPEGSTISIADLSQIPFYNADIADKPAAVALLLQQMGAADAFIFGCTEYNYSIAPALKNGLGLTGTGKRTTKWQSRCINGRRWRYGHLTCAVPYEADLCVFKSASTKQTRSLCQRICRDI